MGRMDMHSRNQYLKALIGKYLKASKRAKGELLDEYCRNTGHNRKYVIRKIRRLAFTEPRPRRARKPRYGYDVRGVVAQIWELFDHPCGQRLQPLLVGEVDRLRAMGVLRISDPVAQKVKSMSSATIDRVLRPVKERWGYERKANRPHRANLLYKKIPLKLTDWDTKTVGYVEMDLVCHCGASTGGEYINTLSVMEIASGWWEAEAVMGRGQRRTFEAIAAIRQRSAFEWKGIDCDNDSVFINAHLLRYCTEQGLDFTRSRPNRKNDNAYIEQKNYTHVRKPLGYLRYDTDGELQIINSLYRDELRLFKNFFQPVMKLIQKQRIDGRLKRKYDVPKTPYQRLIESGQLPQDKAQSLRRLYEKLNPAELKNGIDQKLDKLYEIYHDKKKTTITVNPYKKLRPSTVTFSMIQQEQFRSPG